MVFPVRERYFLGHAEPVVVNTNAVGGTDHDQTPETVTTTVVNWNQPGRMYHNLTRSKQSTLSTRVLQNGTVVALNKPINPYTEDTTIVSAHLPQFEYEATNSAVLSYDLPRDTQIAYLQTAFATLLAKDRLPLAEETSPIPIIGPTIGLLRIAKRRIQHIPIYSFIMENDAPLTLIDERFKQPGKKAQRTSRTGGPTHLHVAKVSERSFAGKSSNVPSVEAEQQLIRDFQRTSKAQSFLQTVQRFLTAGIHDQKIRERATQHVSLVMESGTPVGYSIRFDDITRRNLIKNTPYIADVLAGNFEGYKIGMALLAKQIDRALQHDQPLPASLTQEMLDSIIVQPALRRYMRFEKNDKTGKERFVVYIAPQVISHTGPMEPAGLILHRGPEYPKRTTAQQETWYIRRLKRKVDSLTRRSKRVVHEVERRKVFTAEERP